MCVYTHIYRDVTTINETEAINLKEGREGYTGRFGRKKRQGEILNFNIISKMFLNV